MVKELNYRELIAQLGILPGSLLMVTADLTRLIIKSRRMEGGFNIDLFINSIQDHIGPEGTLVIPAFNFNLKNNDHFNPSRSLPITGAIAIAALKRKDFTRTRHPLHSFLAWGKHAGSLAALQNSSSFGKDSPFAFMKEHHALMLLIDTRVSAAFTFVHHVEEMEKVRYRKYRKINVFIDGENHGPVKQKFLLFAKKPGWTMDLEGIENILTGKEIARRFDFDHVSCTVVDLESAYPLIKEDIHYNGAKNLARFSPGLYFREKAKTALAAAGIHTLADKISHDPGLL